jgi:aldose 1-epimerase
MPNEADAVRDDALRALPPGELIRIANGSLQVEIAPAAGGRIAQITRDRVDWLVGYAENNAAMIAWGSYPMLPWAGRIRRGRFDFQGRNYQLPLNLGEHAIHGVGFALPWSVESRAPSHVDLSLRLPEDERWPFGGSARQRIEVGANGLRMTLSLTSGARAMPASMGWHPWLRKPDRLEFDPERCYPRDAEGIAVLPLIEPPSGPWDDCFINDRPIFAERAGQRLRLTSDCRHWVIYDQTGHATCVEPQTGPPDAFNLAPTPLAPKSSLMCWFAMDWL